MNIAVFCASSQPRNPRFVTAAAELGRGIARGGHTLLYGGSNLGLMGVVSGAAMDSGGRVVGVIPTLFGEKIIQSQSITETIRVGSMLERKEYLIQNSDAFIALPGGIGTIDEVTDVLVANQLQIANGRRVLDGTYRQKPMILLNIDGYFDSFFAQIQRAIEEGLMRSAVGLQVIGSVDECQVCLTCPE